MRPLDMFFALAVVAIWGGNFVSAKYGVAHFPPFFLTSLRFTVVGLVLLAFVPRPSKLQMRRIAQLALVLGVLHLALLFAAMYRGLDIASCAIIAQLGVPFSCLLGAWLHKDRLGPWRIGGMAIAFIGMMIVTGTPNIVQHPLGFTLALAGAFCWGVSNIIIKRIEGVSILTTLAWMSLFAVPQLWLVSAVFEHGQWQSLHNIPLSGFVSVAYTAFGSTIIAYGMWYHLLQKYQVSQVAPFSLLTPVFGIAFGQLFFTDSLSWQVVVGGVITIIGVAILVMRRPKLTAWSEAT